MLEVYFINVNEVNPIAYKSSVIPNLLVCEISDAILNNFFSSSVSGGINSRLSIGLGSAFMSVFPFGDFGISSICINTVGTIYFVNLSFKYSFNSLISISFSAVKYAHK